VAIDIVLGAVLLALVVFVLWLRRYVRTDAFRHSDVRRATFELLVVIGPFFGVRVKPPEPEPAAVMTPKGDDDDPNAALFRIGPPRDDDANAGGQGTQDPPPGR
jgi:hypothetical protein